MLNAGHGVGSPQDQRTVFTENKELRRENRRLVKSLRLAESRENGNGLLRRGHASNQGGGLGEMVSVILM